MGAAIARLMPRHRNYVEAFCGSCKVLFARDPTDETLWTPMAKQGDRGVSERVNDLDGRVTNFWRVLGDPDQFAHFQRAALCTPFSRIEFDAAGEAPLEPFGEHLDWQAALRFFVRNRMSRAADGKSLTSPVLNRCRGGIDDPTNAWLGAVDGLAAVHARLRRVVVEHMDALKLIVRDDYPDTLFYLDPPYVHSARQSKALYGKYEFTDRQHAELLAIVKACKGKVILSGYANPMYDAALSHWRRLTFDKANHTAGGGAKDRRTECLWLNYDPPTGG
jgi:DNA adenine methylase